jgi:hypothetical protein
MGSDLVGEPTSNQQRGADFLPTALWKRADDRAKTVALSKSDVIEIQR